MKTIIDPGCNCSPSPKKQLQTQGVFIQPSLDVAMGIRPQDPLIIFEKPGYQLCPFVKGFISTDIGPVPQVQTVLSKTDKFSTTKVRLGINRGNYKIAPGLYGVGKPDKKAEVLVTANYKLSFDHLRKELEGINAWILVLDTRGINVWCASGKGTFSTSELVKRIKSCNLEKIISHKSIIVPQLGATGVSATDVKKQSGFTVVYGPVRAEDIPEFLRNNKQANQKMRQVTFSFMDRLILTPVELRLVFKPALLTALIVLLISGFGPGIYSFDGVVSKGIVSLVFLALGVVAGAFFTPVLLPYIPFKSFAAKGMLLGGILAVAVLIIVSEEIASMPAFLSLALFTAIISSYLAMNFTGATPFTSPSGVEKEMKRFIPLQALGLLSAAILWVYSLFL